MLFLKSALAGAAAGAINGLFGAGGGMILVPLLTLLVNMDNRDLFPSSISIMLPICLVTLALHSTQHSLPWKAALPYLIGSAAGGLLAGLLGNRIPTIWLHRILGAFILWGGWRYLC